MDQQAGEAGARTVGPGLRRAADYAWRLLVLGVAVYVLFRILLRFELVFIALFVALIITSLMHPPVRVLARRMPRPLAVLTTVLGCLALLAGLVWLVAESVSDESSSLGNEFRGGIDQIRNWLQGPPFHVNPSTLNNLQSKLTAWLSDHRSTLINQALTEASRIVEIATGLALALFCAVFFTTSGERMWLWFIGQLPSSAQETWARCGRTAWTTFAGYTRGTILVAASNAIMVGVALKLLRVPLVLPLTLLEFVASFVPLIGSPVALAVATVVALASRGVTTAAVVLALIVIIGQIEGHLLQPFVLGWQVRLHPVAVAVCVIAGTSLAGLIGAVVAVPLASIGWAVYQALRPPRSPRPPLPPPGLVEPNRSSA
jgi:predicted PurR-regulated permease PerM